MNESSPIFFTVIGGFWAVITFLTGYIDNGLKRKLEYFRIIKDYNNELRDWSYCIIDLMTEAVHLCLLNPQKDTEFYIKRHNLLLELSSWIDKGRFFLPNTGFDNHGQHKPSAYRGFRSEALDYIVECYSLVHKIDYTDKNNNSKLRQMIVDCKRNFVSVIQDQLDPKKFEKEVVIGLKERFHP